MDCEDTLTCSTKLASSPLEEEEGFIPSTQLDDVQAIIYGLHRFGTTTSTFTSVNIFDTNQIVGV